MQKCRVCGSQNYGTCCSINWYADYAQFNKYLSGKIYSFKYLFNSKKLLIIHKSTQEVIIELSDLEIDFGYLDPLLLRIKKLLVFS